MYISTLEIIIQIISASGKWVWSWRENRSRSRYIRSIANLFDSNRLKMIVLFNYLSVRYTCSHIEQLSFLSGLQVWANLLIYSLSNPSPLILIFEDLNISFMQNDWRLPWFTKVAFVLNMNEQLRTDFLFIRLDKTSFVLV